MLYEPSGPVCSLKVVVEPAQKNLLRRQSEKLLQRLVFLQEAIKLRVQFDIDFTQETTANDLPNETKDQMLAHLNNIASTNVDDRAADTFAGFNDDIVVFAHLEGIEVLRLSSRDIQDTLVDRIGNTIIDEFCKDQSVLAVIKHLEGVGWEWEPTAEICVAGEDGVDMASELSALVFIDGVRDVGAGTLHLNLATHAALGDVTSSSLCYRAT